MITDGAEAEYTGLDGETEFNHGELDAVLARP